MYLQKTNILLSVLYVLISNLSRQSSGLKLSQRSLPNNMFYIFNGDAAAPRQFPYQVSLRVGRIKCGGSILGKRWILTAAHCFDEWVYGQDVEILAGSLRNVFNVYESDVKTGEQLVSVKTIYLHPDYKSLKNDITLLYLHDPLTISSYVDTISLPSSSYEPAGNVIASGWGRTEDDEPPTHLRYTDCLQIIDRATCTEERDSQILNSQICAGSQDGSEWFYDVCSGDSGGPLTKMYQEVPYLVGIVSYGPLCSDKTAKTPGVYTNVAYYVDWINSKMNAVE